MEPLTAQDLINILLKYPSDTPIHLEDINGLVWDMKAHNISHDPEGILVISTLGINQV